jgi:integrase
MAERHRIGLREVRELAPNSLIWDTRVPGFGARRRTGTAVSYFVLYRVEGRLRRLTIGKHGAPWTPDQARDRARAALTEVANGRDPAADKQAHRQSMTVNDLCTAYLAEAEAGTLLTRRRVPKKAETLRGDRSRIAVHIRPLLGAMKVAAVTSIDIERFMNAVAVDKAAGSSATVRKQGGRTAASRTVGLLGAIFAYAKRRHLRTDNPVHGVVRPADGRRERRLSDQEYVRLGDALRDQPTWPAAVAAVRFLALSGWRKGEVSALEWRDIDFARRTVVLPDSKTGRSIRPLSNVAADVLRGMPRIGDRVFPATRAPGQVAGLRSLWTHLVGLSALAPDVTPHVLRHSFASTAGVMSRSARSCRWRCLSGRPRHEQGLDVAQQSCRGADPGREGPESLAGTVGEGARGPAGPHGCRGCEDTIGDGCSRSPASPHDGCSEGEDTGGDASRAPCPHKDREGESGRAEPPARHRGQVQAPRGQVAVHVS